jgi:hypothetical protein
MIQGQQLQKTQLAGEQQAQQQRAALFPGQLQEQENLTAGSGIDLQMKQLGLKNAQITNSALSDPNLSSELDEWQKQKGGDQEAPTGGTGIQLHPLAQFLMEKRGLPALGPGGALEISKNLTESAQQMATLIKTQGDAATSKLTAYGKQIDNLTNAAAPIFEEADPAKQQNALGTFKNTVLANPTDYPPELVKQVQGINTVGDLAKMTNYAKMHETVIEDAQKAAEASQKVTAAAPPTFQQQSDAKNTLASYLAIPAPQRAGLAQEMSHAPDFESLQKIQARADETQKSFQMSADARQNAMAMKDVAVGQAMATQLIGEDKALGTNLDQTRGIRGLLDMSTGGNQAATAAAQTRFAEHEIVEGGVKRMNQVEYENLAGSLGSYGRKFQSWVDGGFKGQMPPATNGEMAKILDAEDATATAAHQRNVGFIQDRFSAINKGGLPTQANPAAKPVNNDPLGIR